MNRRDCLGMALALLLTACASPGPVSSPRPFWTGRMGLLVHSDPEQSLHAGFELQGNAQEGELLMLSPLGGTLARLQWDPAQAVLERGSERWRSRDLASLGQQLLQTPLPIEALFAWLQRESLNKDGWSVNLERWSAGRITAERRQPGPAATLTIVFEQ